MMGVKGEKNDCRTCLEKSGIKASEGKQVYISKETYYRISMIVRLLGNGEATIADFTENVVRRYLRTYRNELDRTLNATPKIELWA